MDGLLVYVWFTGLWVVYWSRGGLLVYEWFTGLRVVYWYTGGFYHSVYKTDVFDRNDSDGNELLVE